MNLLSSVDRCSNGNVLVQSANTASPVVIRTATPNNIASQSAAAVPISASGVSVVPQPVGATAPPVQQIRVLQAASAQPQVVQTPQQYQVMTGATQTNAGLTLIQTPSGQLVLQQSTDHVTTSPAPQIMIDSSSQPARLGYGGNVPGVQLASGIQLQSAVAAQPVVLQQQSVTPSNRNIIVQTLPVVSASPDSSIIQLGQLSGTGSGGGATITQHVSSLSRPTQPMPAAQSTDHNGVLVQIGGQTYRMQGVQSVQVANAAAVRPVQTQQRYITPATPGQATTTPPCLTGQPLVATKQLATPGKMTSLAVPGQTITLTPSQLALLKQTPPEKQMGMIQLFQRQIAQRSSTRPAVSSGVNSAVASPIKSVQIVQNSGASSAGLQRTPLTARFSSPTVIRAGPPIAVRVGQNPTSSTAGNTQQSVGLQVLCPKPASEVTTTQSAVVGQ